SMIDAESKRWVRLFNTPFTPKAEVMTPDMKDIIIAMAGGNGTITKYDAETFSIIAEFQSGINPAQIAITSDGTKGYITDGNAFDSHKIVVFDPVSMTMTKTISSTLITEPFSVAFSPDNAFAYICGVFSDNIIRIDTKNDSILASIPIPGAQT